jgi:hypothetical protein
VSDGTTASQGYQAEGTSQPRSTIEFFNPDRTRAGYGKAQGGTVEFFNPDSSRRGFGKGGK